MPNMNGFELCKELLKIDGKIKVFFVSAFETYADNNLKAEFANINGRHFIDKPVSIAKLVKAIVQS